MSVLYDARGNEFAGSLDALQGVTINDARAATASLAALNAETLVDLNGHCTAMIDVRGTFVGTWVVEGTVDGTNYLTMPTRLFATGQYAVNAFTAVNTVIVPVTGIRRLRVRCSAFTSGAMVVSIRCSTADSLIQTEHIGSPLALTATGAAAAAVTLTLTAPGAGLFHYIDYIDIQHFTTALLVAAAAPVLVTTTNISGTPSIPFRADAAPQGTLTTYRLGGGASWIKSLTANTATTVVMPATTSVIWRATAYYRIGA